MAKDALGHGSESRVSRVARGEVPAAHSYKIQHLNTSLIGPNPWQTVKGTARRAVAERIAQHMRVDHPDTLVRTRR